MDTRAALNNFFCRIERRAYLMAEIATRNPEDAFEIVQESMFSLVKNYAGRNEAEWPAIFHRILQNKIRDWYRKSRVRAYWQGIFSGSGKRPEEGAPGEEAVDRSMPTPQKKLELMQSINRLEDILRELPLRQQQVVILRVWEGLEIEAIAKILGCSKSSIKTHYMRAMKRIRKELEEYSDAA